MTRRPPGTGTVARVKGGRWVAVLELPRSIDGKRQRRWRRADTEAKARAHLKQMEKEFLRTGTVADARRSLNEAIDAYRSTRPPSAHDDWLFGLIRSGLGQQRVARLTVDNCDEFLANCATGAYGKKPIGQDHLRRTKQRLAAVLRNEVRLDHINQNVAEVAELPATDTEPRGRRALTIPELRQLLEAAEGYLLMLVDLCGRNGLRPAEARALRWCDLDLTEAELSITGQMNRHNERGPVKRAHNAQRTIRIDATTTKRLTTWRADRDLQQDHAGRAWHEEGFVVVHSLGGPVGRELFAGSLKATCVQASIDPPVTPYELRHSAISHQADAGRTSWEIADWAGTSEAMISSRYRHRLRRVAEIRPVDSDHADDG